MSRLSTVAVVLLATLLAGACAQSSRYRPVDRGLDKAFAYSEHDRTGKNHGISDESDADAKTPTQVPDPALVDIESTLAVRANPDWAPAGAGRSVPQEDNVLLRQKKHLTQLTKSIDTLIAQRQVTVEAIANRGGAARASDWQPIDDRAIEIIVALETYALQRYADRVGVDPERIDVRNLPPSISSQERRVIFAANDKFRESPEYQGFNFSLTDQTFKALKAYVLGEIEKLAAAIASADERLERRVRETADGATVRLTANLLRPGVANPVPLHLPNYDRLPEGQLATIDRAGLDLSEEERANLAKQVAATEELSRTLESIRKREVSIQVGLLSMLETADPVLRRQVGELRTVVDKITSTNRRTQLQAASTAVTELLKNKAGETDAALNTKLENFTQALVERYQGTNSTVGQLVELTNEVDNLLNTLKGKPSTEAITTTLTSSAAIAAQAKDLAQSNTFAELVKDVSDQTTVTAEELGTQVATLWGEVATAPERVEFERQLQSYVKDFKDTQRLAKDIYESLRPAQFAAEAILENPSHVFDVPVDELRDTSLDLTLVDAKPGDRIVIRGQQLKGDEVVDETRASFEITRYGWWARLSPSVVLVRPDELADGNETFQFAPAISWNHHYSPRPSQKGFWSGTARALQPAAGIHTTFLPYDSNNGIAIGMGGTLSFWEDRLQLGLGFNLMASNSGEGRTYYFIGSDLIGLLQTLNVGN